MFFLVLFLLWFNISYFYHHYIFLSVIPFISCNYLFISYNRIIALIILSIRILYNCNIRLSIWTFIFVLIILSFVSLLGVYLSRYADLLQANPLEAGAVGDVVIFKIMKVILTFIFQYIKDDI